MYNTTRKTKLELNKNKRYFINNHHMNYFFINFIYNNKIL